MVGGLDLDTDTVSSTAHSGQAGCARTRERIKHCVTDETEHPDQWLDKLGRVRRWMGTSRSAAHGNDLPGPFLVGFLTDHTQYAHRLGGSTIGARLALHQDKLDVVLYDGVRFIWLPKE